MAITVNADLRLNHSITHTNTVDLSRYSSSTSINSQASLSSSDISKVYTKTISVTTTPTVLDVTSLTEQGFSQSQNFANVKYLHVEHTGASGTLTVGGGTNPLVTASSLTAGGWIDLKTTIATSGSIKNLTLTASAGTITTNVYLLGN